MLCLDVPEWHASPLAGSLKVTGTRTLARILLSIESLCFPVEHQNVAGINTVRYIEATYFKSKMVETIT